MLVRNDILDKIMTKAKKLDLSKYGYKIVLYDKDKKVDDNSLTLYIESLSKDNRFNAMYRSTPDNEGWSYYYDEQEGFFGGWVYINPTNLINLVKITNYLSSSI